MKNYKKAADFVDFHHKYWWKISKCQQSKFSRIYKRVILHYDQRDKNIYHNRLVIYLKPINITHYYSQKKITYIIISSYACKWSHENQHVLMVKDLRTQYKRIYLLSDISCLQKANIQNHHISFSHLSITLVNTMTESMAKRREEYISSYRL